MGTRVTLADNVPGQLDGTSVVAGYFWRADDGEAVAHLERAQFTGEAPRAVRPGEVVDVDGHLWKVVDVQLRKYVRDYSPGSTITLELVDEDGRAQ